MFFFFKQKTSYEIGISDGSSDVCPSDLPEGIGCTIIKAATGRRYFHTVSADLHTGAGGAGNLSVHPRTRVSLVVGDTVSFSPLEIEGRIIGEEQRWTFDELRTVGIEFQIEEIA